MSGKDNGQCAFVQTGCVMAHVPRSKPRRPGGWGWVAGAVAVVALLAAGAAWLWWPAAALPSPARVAGSAPLTGREFPWNPQLGADMAATDAAASPAVPSPSLGESKRRFSTAVSNALDAPVRPVWEMLRGYAGPSSEGIDTDIALLAGLSFCAASQWLPDTQWQLRSQGTASGDALQQLDARHTQASVLCARLSERDYVLRTDILRWHARAGDADAQLNFQYVGPTGISNKEGDAGLPQSEAQLAAWGQEVLAYARQALPNETLRAVSTLAWLHDAGPPVPLNPAYSAFHDPVEGHAYRILLARMVRNPHAMADFMQREVARLSPDQVAQGQARAESIAQSLAAQLTAQGKDLPRGLLGPAPTVETPRQQPGPSPFAAQ